MDKIRCRLCEKEYEDKEMSDEHYPAHSVGNDDIVQLNIVKLFDVMMGENSDFKRYITQEQEKGMPLKESLDSFFDNELAESIYPKGRTARTLCQNCNRFLGKYDEAYLKFYDVDGDPKKVKGFQYKTKLQIIKAIFAKFLSIPEAKDKKFDFIDFIRNPEETEYRGKWSLYFVKRDASTDLMGLSDIPTGKIDWDLDGKKIVYELSDDKFIFNLLNFEKHDQFVMNNIFDILSSYKLVEGCHDATGGYHGQLALTRLFKGMGNNPEE